MDWEMGAALLAAALLIYPCLGPHGYEKAQWKETAMAAVDMLLLQLEAEASAARNAALSQRVKELEEQLQRYEVLHHTLYSTLEDTLLDVSEVLALGSGASPEPTTVAAGGEKKKAEEGGTASGAPVVVSNATLLELATDLQRRVEQLKMNSAIARGVTDA
eukprot:gene3719-2618_t